jgi:hypothetical protein
VLVSERNSDVENRAKSVLGSPIRFRLGTSIFNVLSIRILPSRNSGEALGKRAALIGRATAGGNV